ncbi:para-aminobenzoate synthase, (PABA) [Blastocladiella emersonii ATCC 22665]|nr:para-aminobenzoate synthase, (PABA) [Blastocladiella emersonii ATCC 22665]
MESYEAINHRMYCAQGVKYELEREYRRDRERERAAAAAAAVAQASSDLDAAAKVEPAEPPAPPKRFPLRVVIVDNFDSYTFNLYQLLCKSLENPPLVIRNNEFDWPTFKSTILPQVDAVIVSPGPGHPENPKDFGICRDIIKYQQLPVLGVCLGHQGIAAAFACKVVRAPEVMHGRVCAVQHNGTGLYAGIPSPFNVVRYHSLIVDEDRLSPAIEADAWTTDESTGRRIIMGLHHHYSPQYGVQFHPESICSEHGQTIITNFCQLALDDRNCRGAALAGPSDAAWAGLVNQHTVVPSFYAPTVDPTRDERAAPARCRVYEMDWADPEAVYAKFYADEKYTVWLDSARVEGATRWSYIGAMSMHGFALSYSAKMKSLRTTYHPASDRAIDVQRGVDSFFDHLNEVQQKFRINLKHGPTVYSRFGKQIKLRRDALPPFLGGLAGYVGYEMKAESLSLPPHAKETGFPDASFVLLDRVLCFDHKTLTVYAAILDTPLLDNVPGLGPLSKSQFDWLRDVSTSMNTTFKLPPRALVPLAVEPHTLFTPDLDRDAYLAAIAQSRELIDQGETYEVCMTTTFRHRVPVGTRVDPFELYRSIRQRNPAPYGALLKIGDDVGTARWIACSSPERFLCLDRDGTVTMKPIKGTARRGATPDEDAAIRDALQNNVKDRAENLMIVDLIRNDLNLISKPDTVRVPHLMHVESYETVHQLVSTIQGDLDPRLTAVDALRHSFPPGSMTGAPKLRTVQLLEDQLEAPAPRGVYSGSIGFLSACGTAHFNVVIRTATYDPAIREIAVGAGGAIVALSDPADEWDEVLLKLNSAAAGVAAYLAELEGDAGAAAKA